MIAHRIKIEQRRKNVDKSYTLEPGQVWPLTWIPKSENDVINRINAITPARLRQDVARVVWYNLVDLNTFTVRNIKRMANLYDLDDRVDYTEAEFRAAMKSVGLIGIQIDRKIKTFRYFETYLDRGLSITEKHRSTLNNDDPFASLRQPYRQARH